jgi:hypothetical protein
MNTVDEIVQKNILRVTAKLVLFLVKNLRTGSYCREAIHEKNVKQFRQDVQALEDLIGK